MRHAAALKLFREQQGRQRETIEEARANLQRLAAVVFNEERIQSEELLEGKEVVRERFRVFVPRF